VNWSLGYNILAQGNVDEAMPLARMTGGRSLARALIVAGFHARSRGEFDRAESLILEAGKVLDSIDETEIELEMGRLAGLGNVYSSRGDYIQGKHWFEVGLEYARRNKHLTYELIFLGNIGAVERDAGNLNKAVSYVQTAIMQAREGGLREPLSHYLLVLSSIYIKMGSQADAQLTAIEGITIARARGLKNLVIIGLAYYARVTAANGDVSRGIVLFGLALAQEIITPSTQGRIDEFIAELALPAEEVEAGLAAGAALDFDTVVQEILDGDW
jgi:tetratricopeptide (TPR) repeat protein